jgi:very-short-patch-repair endonuclease
MIKLIFKARQEILELIGLNILRVKAEEVEKDLLSVLNN